MQHSIAIIGGGISGISAALELERLCPECQIDLYESSGRLGGVLETLKEGPYLIERGADNFATLIPDALQLSRDIGIEDSLIQPCRDNRRAFVLKNGTPEPIPLGFSLMQPTQVLPILASRTLSIPGKLRLLGEYFVPPRNECVKGSMEAFESDESLESFAIRRLGREAFEALVEPIVGGIFTADPSTLSMQATMPQFLKMEREHGGLIRAALAGRRKDAEAMSRRASGARYDQFLAPESGMSDWVNRLANKIPRGNVQLDTRVSGLNQTSEGWSVSTGSNNRAYSGIVLATPASATSRLLTNVDKEAAEIVGSIHYASSAVVALVLPKSEILGRTDAFGLICPSREKRRSLAISFGSNKYPGRVPKGETLLRIFFGGARDQSVLEMCDAELLALALREVTDLLNWRGIQPKWSRVIRWPNAMPQYTLGHTQRVDKLDELLRDYQGISVCGAAFRGVGIPQCVRSGRLAAKQVLKDLGAE